MDLIVLQDSRVFVELSICTIPTDYYEQTCYLCNGMYGETQLYKLQEEKLFACATCYLGNWHKLREWRPYFMSMDIELRSNLHEARTGPFKPLS